MLRPHTTLRLREAITLLPHTTHRQHILRLLTTRHTPEVTTPRQLTIRLRLITRLIITLRLQEARMLHPVM